MDHSDCTRGNQLYEVVMQALDEGIQICARLGETFADCAAGLRVGHTNGALAQLQQAIGDLSLLAEFVAELAKGLGCLGRKGGYSPDWRAFAMILKEVVAALEARDWILLADMIQFELCPLLEGTGKEFARIEARLGGVQPKCPARQ